MNIIFFDDANRDHLLPLTFTRPSAKLRCGILNLEEKWLKRLPDNLAYSYLTEDYLAKKFPLVETDTNLYINPAVCPTQQLMDAVLSLGASETLMKGEIIIASRTKAALLDANEQDTEVLDFEGDFNYISRPYHLFQYNGAELELDYKLLTDGRQSASISETNTIIGDDVFVEEGAFVEAAVLNAKSGPIYIGKDATVMEGSVVRGPFALCDHSTLKLSAKIYGPTTIGPHCKVGGEVNNSLLLGYSNKGHDGFLGNSVIGEWCNIGADSNNSNLKNNYEEVKLWDYVEGRFAKTGLQFCGLVMGDHSKCGINTMFNTGTVVGVSANIYGGGFPRNFISSFAWGGSGGFTEYRFDKAMKTAALVMERRGIELDEVERDILQVVFDKTASYRA
ncbi:MAG: GlmU family protein [Bacteroidetes bacterium]|nr:GlmU family protein [Bacteroidota bacterium]